MRRKSVPSAASCSRGRCTCVSIFFNALHWLVFNPFPKDGNKATRQGVETHLRHIFPFTLELVCVALKRGKNRVMQCSSSFTNRRDLSARAFHILNFERFS